MPCGFFNVIWTRPLGLGRDSEAIGEQEREGEGAEELAEPEPPHARTSRRTRVRSETATCLR